MDGLDVVGLGYAGWDYLGIVPHLPRFDADTMTLAGFARCGGGPVATALATLARLGARTAYLGVLGDDESGCAALADLRARGVDTARVQVRRGALSHTCMVLVEAGSGRRSILCSRGTLGELALAEEEYRMIGAARWLHLDGQFMAAALEAAARARAVGVRISLDANRPRPGLEELLPLVDLLITSTTFPAAFTGCEDLAEALRDLRALGPRTVVSTLGAQGCAYLEKRELVRVPACEVEVIDTTGAGDAFHGAWLHGELRGWPRVEKARFANAVAALNCGALGGRAGLPDEAAARALMEGSG